MTCPTPWCSGPQRTEGASEGKGFRYPALSAAWEHQEHNSCAPLPLQPALPHTLDLVLLQERGQEQLSSSYQGVLLPTQGW